MKLVVSHTESLSDLINFLGGNGYTEVTGNPADKPITKFVHEGHDVAQVIWIARWAVTAYKAANYLQLDCSFRGTRPFAYSVPMAIIRNVAVPLGFIMTPTEHTDTYTNFMQALWELIPSGERKRVDVLSDQGPGLISFCKTHGIKQYFCHRHLIEKFGASSPAGMLAARVLRCQTVEEYQELHPQFIAEALALHANGRLSEKSLEMFTHWLHDKNDLADGLWHRVEAGIARCSNHIERFHGVINQRIKRERVYALPRRLRILYDEIMLKANAYANPKPEQRFRSLRDAVKKLKDLNRVQRNVCNDTECTHFSHMMQRRFGIPWFPCAHTVHKEIHEIPELPPIIDDNDLAIFARFKKPICVFMNMRRPVPGFGAPPFLPNQHVIAKKKKKKKTVVVWDDEQGPDERIGAFAGVPHYRISRGIVTGVFYLRARSRHTALDKISMIFAILNDLKEQYYAIFPSSASTAPPTDDQREWLAAYAVRWWQWAMTNQGYPAQARPPKAPTHEEEPIDDDPTTQRESRNNSDAEVEEDESVSRRVALAGVMPRGMSTFGSISAAEDPCQSVDAAEVEDDEETPHVFEDIEQEDESDSLTDTEATDSWIRRPVATGRTEWHDPLPARTIFRLSEKTKKKRRMTDEPRIIARGTRTDKIPGTEHRKKPRRKQGVPKSPYAKLPDATRRAALPGPTRPAALPGPTRPAALPGPTRPAALPGPTRPAALPAGPAAFPARPTALPDPTRPASLPAGPAAFPARPAASRDPSLPIGIDNLGDTCYFNACMQCFAHLEPFSSYFASDQCNSDRSAELPNGKQHNLFAQTYQYLQLNLAKGDPIPLSTLRDIIPLIAPKVPPPTTEKGRAHAGAQSQGLQSGGQEPVIGADVPEILMYFLSLLHEDLNLGTPASDVQELTNRAFSDSPDQGWSLAWLDLTSTGCTIVTQLFWGISQLTSSPCPECGYQGNEFLPFLILHLNIPLPSADMPQITLGSCFDHTCFDEVRFTCDACHNHTTAVRMIHYAKLPPVLVIALARFSNRGATIWKDTTVIQFEDSLDMTEWLSSARAPGPCNYRLHSVMVHSVNPDHYVSYIRVAGQWLKFNDTAVTKVTWNEVSRVEAYILVYVQ
jgi:ubiquitin C-terminal hydrolase